MWQLNNSKCDNSKDEKLELNLTTQQVNASKLTPNVMLNSKYDITQTLNVTNQILKMWLTQKLHMAKLNSKCDDCD